jgi:hypothetical protein
MVFIEDAGSEFDAPLDVVWKLNQAHATEAAKIHPQSRNNQMEMVNETTFISSWEEAAPDGKIVKIKAKGAIHAPLGVAFEILEGPLTGSKFYNYYIPKGGKTGVTVVGDFKSAIIPDEQLESVVLAFLEKAFNEDSAYLKDVLIAAT